jgi:hypothetical protein
VDPLGGSPRGIPSEDPLGGSSLSVSGVGGFPARGMNAGLCLVVWCPVPGCEERGDGDEFPAVRNVVCMCVWRLVPGCEESGGGDENRADSHKPLKPFRCRVCTRGLYAGTVCDVLTLVVQ